MRNNIFCLLLAFCFFAFSCVEPMDLPEEGGEGGGDDNNGYKNPNAGISRELAFSHDSGLYPQSFSLALTAPADSVIYYSIDGSTPSPEKADKEGSYVYTYSSPITVQNRNGQPNILSARDNFLQMYARENDQWPGSVPSNYVPTSNQVAKATVIRAVAVDKNGNKSGVITKTYFIGNNLANYAEHRVISLVTDPENLVSESIGIMVRGKASNHWVGTAPGADLTDAYNFQQKGSDWEREAYFELFEGNAGSRTVTLSTGVGIRSRGGYSRGAAQKSLNVYFREEFGIKNLQNFHLIPGAVKADGVTPVEKYKNFTLRNGGNDFESTKFYDVFTQDLVKDRNFTTQAAAPCIVYLNGEYWGPYNIQEKYGDNHTEYKYGVIKENVISFENDAMDDGLPEEVDLWKDVITKGTADMSVQANYDVFCEIFDIDNFIDYWAAQIYVDNEDWPHSNYRSWRTREIEPGNPYGDTKWRWQMFDLDCTFGVNNEGTTSGGEQGDAFNRILKGGHNITASNCRMFKALLANEGFCRQFVNTMMDLYNVNFDPVTVTPLLNNYINTYRPLMDGYFAMWGHPDDFGDGGWNTVFNDVTINMKNYLEDIRVDMTEVFLPEYFGGYYPDLGIAPVLEDSDLCNVTFRTEGASGVSIKINTVTPNLSSGSWTGLYYSENPITVTAGDAPAGRVFEGWAVTGGTPSSSTEQSITVTLSGKNAQITANYRGN